MTCKNCDKEVSGNYCAHCGQSSKVDRITLTSFMGELSESVFQINKGFFYSLIQLFIRPGHSIRTYLAGQRKNHFKPIAYTLTLSTVYFLLSQLTHSGTILSEVVIGFTNGIEDPTAPSAQLKILTWFAKNYAYTTLMLLPVYSLGSYLAFRGSRYNYLEHVVLNAYIIGQQAILYALFTLPRFWTDYYYIDAFPIGCSIAYAFWVFWQFFSEQAPIIRLLRSLLTYMIYVILLALVTGIILFIIKLLAA